VLGKKEDNMRTALEKINLLDECLYLRRLIRDLITSIKENMSRIDISELKNNINTIVNALRYIMKL
jgi:predicted transcriptional regulator